MPDSELDHYTPCSAEGCPGMEWHEGKPEGCGHPTKTSGCEGPASYASVTTAMDEMAGADATEGTALDRDDGIRIALSAKPCKICGRSTCFRLKAWNDHIPICTRCTAGWARDALSMKFHAARAPTRPPRASADSGKSATPPRPSAPVGTATYVDQHTARQKTTATRGGHESGDTKVSDLKPPQSGIHPAPAKQRMRDLAVAVCPTCERAFIPEGSHDIAAVVRGDIHCTDGGHAGAAMVLRRFREVEQAGRNLAQAVIDAADETYGKAWRRWATEPAVADGARKLSRALNDLEAETKEEARP